MRKCVVAERHVDTGGKIVAQRLHPFAVHGECGRAMGDGRAALGQEREIAAGRPVQMRMMVKIDAMTDGAVRPQQPHLGRPLDGAHAVAGNEFGEFARAFGRMDMERPARRARQFEALAQQIRRGGFQFGGRNHRGKAAARVRFGRIHHCLRLIEQGVAAIWKPVILQHPVVGH